MSESTLWSSNVTAEGELVARMCAGDQRAFDAFFNAYATRLAGFAARRCALDAAGLEDVVQQTMINAVKNLESFRGDSTLFTWLCQICRNLLADIRRKEARQPSVVSLDPVTTERSAALPVQLIDYRDPLDICSADAQRSDIRRVVNSLPPRYVRVLELKYGDELSLEEMALSLGLSGSAAQSLLARARRAFAECWEAHEGGRPGEPGMRDDVGAS